MCDTCGCGEGVAGYRITKPSGIKNNHSGLVDQEHFHGDHHHHTHDHGHGSGHTHEHSHEHDHHHNTNDHDEEQARRIIVETDILQRNNLLAERNRGYFEARGIMALNLVSSPGSGKTTILEKTIKALSGYQIYVIEGDQQTTLDAEKIDATGTPVLQINTGSGCHLDAEMIHKAVRELDPQNKSLLFIENVGNLVCPALFDLGESARIVIISVTEGEDKPLKYPNMFQSSQICIINKTDLLPYVDFNLEQIKKYALKVNPDLSFIDLSARTGEGFGDWIQWIKEQIS